jgi:hypothetical protein
MSENSVTEYYLFINEQIVTQEKMLEYHLKADSMLKVLLESNLSRYSPMRLFTIAYGVSRIIPVGLRF